MEGGRRAVTLPKRNKDKDCITLLFRKLAIKKDEIFKVLKETSN